MSHHVSQPILERFVAGDLETDEAVEVATHIDDCVSCANRAIALEPLAAAFAAVEDPEVPEGLPAAILAELQRPGLPLVELGVGSGMLLAAALLLYLVDGPVRPVVDSFTVATAVTSAAERFAATLSIGEQAAILLLALIGVLATVRLATGRAAGRIGSDRRTA